MHCGQSFFHAVNGNVVFCNLPCSQFCPFWYHNSSCSPLETPSLAAVLFPDFFLSGIRQRRRQPLRQLRRLRQPSPGNPGRCLWNLFLALVWGVWRGWLLMMKVEFFIFIFRWILRPEPVKPVENPILDKVWIKKSWQHFEAVTWEVACCLAGQC